MTLFTLLLLFLKGGMQKSISQQPLSCIKEGWRRQTSNKFETSEQFHPIPAFQNGGTEVITKICSRRESHVVKCARWT